MFRSVGAACAVVWLVVIAPGAKGDLINPLASGVCSWTVSEIFGGSVSGTSTLPIPANQTNVVSSGAPLLGGAQIDTTFTSTHTAASDHFAMSTAAKSGYGSAQASGNLTFTTTDWCVFTLQAQAGSKFMTGCEVSFNGITAKGYFEEYSLPDQWGGDIPQAPDWCTRTGLLAPGTYTFTFSHTQSMHGRYQIPSTGSVAASLDLQAADPAQVPVPGALWLGTALCATALRWARRR